MLAYLNFLAANWIPIAAALGAIGHVFPAKTLASKVIKAITTHPEVVDALKTAASSTTKTGK